MSGILNIFVTTFQGLYLVFADLLGYGWGLIALSILTSVLFSPLEKWTQRLKASETKIQAVIQPQLKKINADLSGQEAWAATQRLYKRYRYHPLKAIRTAAFPLLQLPLLFLAYYSLSSLKALEGISFGPINDLYVADNLLFGLALLPFLMTIINIFVTFVGTFTNRERIQAIIIALFFLAILYPAPSSLLIYWTSNNCCSLIKALYQKLCKDKIQFNRISKLKEAPAWVWTLPLCPFVPTLFLWSNNAAYYSTTSVFSSLCIVGLCSFIVCLFLIKVTQFKYLQRKTVKLFAFILYSSTIGFTFCSLGFATISYFALDYRFALVIIITLLFVALIKILGFRLINYFFTLQIIVLSFLFCYNIGKDQQYQVLLPDYSMNIKLKDKPNIYYFLCESYQNLNYVKRIFNYDSSAFIDNLKEFNYTSYDNVYSNSSYTLGTLMNVFSMSNMTSSTNNKLDISGRERNIIGGGKGNQLLKILKVNGYETSMYFKGDSYFFSKKGEFLDHTDILIGWKIYLKPLMDTNGLISKLLEVFLESMNLSNQVEQDSLKIIEHHVNKNKTSKVPQFVFHRLFKTNHTDPYHYSYKERKDFIESNFYQNGINQGNKEIISIIKYLEQNDPDSIVIFMGDHGAWTYRGYNLEKDLNDLNKTLKQNNLQLVDIINDMFYIFFAIHFPNKYSIELSNISPANLFMNIFQSLNGSPLPPEYFASNCIKLDPQGKNVLCRGKDGITWTQIDQQNR